MNLQMRNPICDVACSAAISTALQEQVSYMLISGLELKI